ncbi:DUF1350 family protein [Trichocoleus desertorum AS-A10]|uniref:DUF1350 family protein n=1 Tax=Trichocoleus desertorum TaxID=1481672 RepID=UPI003297B818
MDWQEVSGNWVLIPPRPIAIIHFLGGAFVATAPHVTYRWLLEHLSRQGYVIIATPFVNTMDHGAIAHQVLRNFERAFAQLQTRGLLQKRYLPIYGLGHSMGCKLHLLIGSSFAVERAGNILISFNNYAARDAIPLMDQLSPSFAVEFTPSPLETMALVAERYQVRRNLLIKFTNDTLDQTITMSEVLKERFPDMVTLQKLPGSHTTPLGQDVAWKSGSVFTPLDAIAQWMKQEVYRELNQLKQSILLWLDPFMKL